MNAIVGQLERVVTSLRWRDENLSSFAERERLGPLLYYVFERHGWPKDASTTDRQSLRRVYYGSAGHNIELLTVLSDLAIALSGRSIRAVAVKGADLATSVYPNVATRPMGDVDVYVPPDRVVDAEEVLAELGYRPWCPEMSVGLVKLVRHARLFVGGPSALPIDLHWSLVGSRQDRRAPTENWLLSQTRATEDCPWAHLTDSAHLLYLSAHMKLQHFEDHIPLLWLVDFHLLANRGGIQWNELFEDAERLDWAGALAAAAVDVRERLSQPLPPPLERLVRNEANLGTHAAVPATGPRTEPERIWSELSTLSWPARLRLACAIVFPSPDYMKFRYPSRSWPLSYVSRWWTMIRKVSALLVNRRRAPLHPATSSPGPRETC